MTDACRHCLARSWLIGELAPWIAGLLDRPGRAARALLTLTDEDLVAAVAPARAEELEGYRERFDAAAAREAVDRGGLDAVCRHAEAYPPQLLELSDAPAVLYVAGRLDALGALAGEEPSVTLVGTRSPSDYGLEMARCLGRGLGAAGVPVVSGLALGIDGAAHWGCLAGGGRPVAVLAGGADVPYPRSHRSLYSEVRERGAVLSEMPPGQRAFRWSFPARNRIMAALTSLTIVVEAAGRSGSLITAEFAQDLGRAVGAVPGRATAHFSTGNNALVRDGARVVLGAEDVLDELFGVEARGRDTSADRLDPTLKKVLRAVEKGAGPSGVARAASLSAGEARAALSRLEADGFLVRGRMGGYERSAAR